jgi:probable HAF family extracellular repeat protein
MLRYWCALLALAAAGCGDAAEVSDSPTSMLRQTPGSYEVIRLTGSLNGTISRGNAINNLGWVAGFSNLPGNETRRAALWREGGFVDLGTLGGPNSNVAWPGINNQGMVVGIAETEDIDPLSEDWSCSAFFPGVTHHICRAFIWEDGVMRGLSTLGGHHGFATGVNDLGQVVGWAETAVADPTCTLPQVLQFRAALWDARTGAVQQLPPLPGDSASAATAINERGDVVGISGDCDLAVGRFSARHAVIWHQGQVSELPNLGGTTWHTPMTINARGDVAGFSNPAGPGDPEGAFIAQAFLWTSENGIRNLGTLDNDPLSESLGMNNRGQVVGISFGGDNGPRGFLWENGVLTNLNQLVSLTGGDVITSAQAIDDEGRITGRIRDGATGATVPVVIRPVGEGR